MEQEAKGIRYQSEGYELYKIYKATGKNRDADRLFARMRRAGINLDME